jgi:hypothetical protein
MGRTCTFRIWGDQFVCGFLLTFSSSVDSLGHWHLWDPRHFFSLMKGSDLSLEVGEWGLQGEELNPASSGTIPGFVEGEVVSVSMAPFPKNPGRRAPGFQFPIARVRCCPLLGKCPAT